MSGGTDAGRGKRRRHELARRGFLERRGGDGGNGGSGGGYREGKRDGGRKTGRRAGLGQGGGGENCAETERKRMKGGERPALAREVGRPLSTPPRRPPPPRPRLRGRTHGGGCKSNAGAGTTLRKPWNEAPRLSRTPGSRAPPTTPCAPSRCTARFPRAGEISVRSPIRPAPSPSP